MHACQTVIPRANSKLKCLFTPNEQIPSKMLVHAKWGSWWCWVWSIWNLKSSSSWHGFREYMDAGCGLDSSCTGCCFCQTGFHPFRVKFRFFVVPTLGQRSGHVLLCQLHQDACCSAHCTLCRTCLCSSSTLVRVSTLFLCPDSVSCRMYMKSLQKL